MGIITVNYDNIVTEKAENRKCKSKKFLMNFDLKTVIECNS